jgi:hypothetical protein
MMGLILVGLICFVGGLLVGRRNKNKVEAAVTAAKNVKTVVLKKK